MKIFTHGTQRLRVALRWFSKGWALESISWKRGLPLDEEMGVDGLWGGLTFGFRAAGIVRILSAILHVGCFFHGTRDKVLSFHCPKSGDATYRQELSFVRRQGNRLWNSRFLVSVEIWMKDASGWLIK